MRWTPPLRPGSPAAPPLARLALLAVALLVPACTPGASLSVVSELTDARLEASLPTAAALVRDPSTADVYLTNLPTAMLLPGTALGEASGVIVHARMLFRPRAGHTPLDPTASNATVRVVVIARGEVGVYSGGGLLLPGGSGETRLTGSIRAGTLRLAASSDRFADALGPAELTLRFDAVVDEAQARRIAARVEDLLDRTLERRPGPR
jgi:hypothetical protein